MRALLMAAVLLAPLAGCSSPDQPGQLTADEDRALNRAAEMLDANSTAFEDASDNIAVENEQ